MVYLNRIPQLYESDLIQDRVNIKKEELVDLSFFVLKQYGFHFRKNHHHQTE